MYSNYMYLFFRFIYCKLHFSGLNRLAACESNKEKIVQKGILNLYNKLLTGPSSEEEQLLVAQGLWLLSFHPRVRQTILEDGVCLQGN